MQLNGNPQRGSCEALSALLHHTHAKAFSVLAYAKTTVQWDNTLPLYRTFRSMSVARFKVLRYNSTLIMHFSALLATRSVDPYSYRETGHGFVGGDDSTMISRVILISCFGLVNCLHSYWEARTSSAHHLLVLPF